MSHSDVVTRSQPDPDGVAVILARYAAIVDDFQSLLAIVKEPLPVCLWSNPLKRRAAEWRDALQRYPANPDPPPTQGQVHIGRG